MKILILLLYAAMGVVETEQPISISEQRRLWVNSDTFKLIRARDGSQLAEARGHVEVLHGPYRLTCDRLIMADEKREGTAIGNVELARKEEGIRLLGQKLVYHENLKQVEITGEPSLIKVDAEGRTTTATGQVMSFDEETRRGEIRGDVHIIQGELTAACGKAVYEAEPDILVLTEDPSTVQGRNEVRGERMTIHVGTDRMVIEGRVTGKVFGDPAAASQAEKGKP